MAWSQIFCGHLNWVGLIADVSAVRYLFGRTCLKSLEIARVEKVSLVEKFGLFQEHWRPKVVAELNGQEVKLVKAEGTFPRHVHESEDEIFMVWRERFRVEFRDWVVELNPGELLVVPRGVEHCTAADEEAEILVFEPRNVVNTDDVTDAVFTAPLGVKV